MSPTLARVHNTTIQATPLSVIAFVGIVALVTTPAIFDSLRSVLLAITPTFDTGIFLPQSPSIPLRVSVGVIVAVCLYVSMVLHELGHIWSARLIGLDAETVTLSAVGAHTNITPYPLNPHHESFIAISGPGVNILSVILSSLSLTILDPTRVQVVSLVLMVMVVVNMTLAVGNLIPIPPLDGSRIARSVLALRTQHSLASADTVAVNIGIALLTLFAVGTGVYVDPIYAAGAVMITVAGYREHRQIQARIAPQQSLLTATDGFTLYGQKISFLTDSQVSGDRDDSKGDPAIMHAQSVVEAVCKSSDGQSEQRYQLPSDDVKQRVRDHGASITAPHNADIIVVPDLKASGTKASVENRCSITIPGYTILPYSVLISHIQTRPTPITYTKDS